MNRLKQKLRRLYIDIFKGEKEFSPESNLGGGNKTSEYGIVNYYDRRLIRDMIQSIGGDSALDFGCGWGRLTCVLDEFFDRVKGVDVSEEMVSEANRLYGEEDKFVPLSDGRIPFPDNSFDLTMSFVVLQHIESPESFIREIERVTEKWILLVETMSGYGDVNVFVRDKDYYVKNFSIKIVSEKERTDFDFRVQRNLETCLLGELEEP